MKIKIINLLIILSLISGICWAMSKKIPAEKTLIGTIENEGRLYRAYNHLFSVNNNPWGGTRYSFNDCFIADVIDEGGYRFSYSDIAHMLTEYYFYRNHTSRDEFYDILMKNVESLGHWNKHIYSNVTEFNGFTCYFNYYNILGESPYDKNDKDYTKILSVLFCYSDSVQFMLSSYNEAGYPFGEENKQLRRAKSLEKNLLFKLKENLKLNRKIITEGIPEPLTEEELKGIHKK